MAVIFIGAIGGLVAHGIIGLFVGAVVFVLVDLTVLNLFNECWDYVFINAVQFHCLRRLE